MTNNGQNRNPQQHAPREQALVPTSPVETTTQALALVPSSIDGAYQLAAWLSNAQLLPPALRGKQADLFTMILAGMELGLPPMAALRGMYIVNGKPALEAKTKAAICLQRGAALYFRRTEYTPEATTWETLRAGQTEPVRSRYTRAEAKEARLLGKEGPWQSYPQRMISWRALGWLCDDVYPDIVLGVATAEDFEDERVTFAPIATVGEVELGAAPAAQPQNRTPPQGVPATAKPAGAPPEPPAPAKPEPRQLTDQEVVALEQAITGIANLKELRTWAAKNIAGVPDGPIRDRLVKAYDAQRELILAAEQAERGGGQ